MKVQPSDTMTIRLSSQTKVKLDELAQHTRRTRSLLAGEAITDYVERELAIVAGLLIKKRGVLRRIWRRWRKSETPFRVPKTGNEADCLVK